jgi:hypothetical protein
MKVSCAREFGVTDKNHPNCIDAIKKDRFKNKFLCSFIKYY